VTTDPNIVDGVICYKVLHDELGRFNCTSWHDRRLLGDYMRRMGVSFDDSGVGPER
jgi:hypothetical protein